jgi:hypothetical protein
MNCMLDTKICKFCGEQAAKDRLQNFYVEVICIYECHTLYVLQEWKHLPPKLYRVYVEILVLWFYIKAPMGMTRHIVPLLRF